MTRRIIPLLLLCAVSCGNKDKRPAGELNVEKTAPDVAQIPTHEDPGPALVRRTGARAATVRPDTTAEVDQIESRNGYVLAVVPFTTLVQPVAGSRTSWIIDAGEQHGVAFEWIGKTAQPPIRAVNGLIVRIQGKTLPSKFLVHWAQPGSSNRRARTAGTMGSIEVAVPAKVVKAKGLDEVFWNNAADAFSRSSGGFTDFARQRATFLAGKASKNTGFQRPPRRSDLHQMMELYSGMTSVNEALQADRGLRVRGEPAADRTIAIADVERVPLSVHPWERMIGELDRKPKIEPLASYVPADMAYMHFGDLRTLVKLVADLDDWASPIAQWLEERPGASHFMSRYEEQLVLERTGLAQQLGHIAAKGVAVAVSDPFLREGTDVSMLFHVANRSALVTALGAFEGSSRTRHPDMTKSSMQIAGVAVQRLHTPDGSVDQYRAEYGEVLVISNSRGALEHLIAAHQQKTPRIAEQGDFRYMRAIYPWAASEEDGFVFISDAFVAHVVSPEVKILEARRMEARADLLAINHAALLRTWIDGSVARSAKELQKSGWVDATELMHPDGSAISFSPDRAARSSWGSVARMTPLRDLEIKKVTPAEAEAYGWFRESYQRYWSAHFDPIGARITRSQDGKQFDVDARMLPLIEATDYDDIIRQVGMQKVLAPRAGIGAEWTMAIGKDARLRRELDGMAKGFIPGSNDIGIDWLGDWVSFGVADRSGLWDMALRTKLVPSQEDEDADIWAGLDVLSTFPIYAAVHIRSKIGLAALLTGLKTWVNDAAPGLVAWGQSEPYRDIPIVNVGEGSEGRGELRGVAVHYATVGDVFVIAFDRPTLLGLIDRHVAGHGPKTPSGPPSASAAQDTQAVFDIQPGPGGWVAKTLLGMAESVLISKHDEIMEDYEVLWRGHGRGKALSSADLRALGVAYLGREPRSPHGGEFKVVDGFATHSIYGDSVRPTMPDIPVDGSPITAVLLRLAKLTMSLEFEGEGDHRGLHSTFGWRWK